MAQLTSFPQTAKLQLVGSVVLWILDNLKELQDGNVLPFKLSTPHEPLRDLTKTFITDVTSLHHVLACTEKYFNCTGISICNGFLKFAPGIKPSLNGLEGCVYLVK